MRTIITFKQRRVAAGATALCAVACLVASPALAAEPAEERLDRLERTLDGVQDELKDLREERDTLKERLDEKDVEQEALVEEIEEMKSGDWLGGFKSAGSMLPPGLRLGAYGEHHFNFREGSGGDQSDIHRFVLFVGYDFNDWIHLITETEIEHGFVDSDDGELVIEQFLVDFNLHPAFNVRIGRILHPAGIINRFHEPTTFFGVERPTFSAQVLPSTYSIDGIGAWGSLTDWLSYEAYVHAGLDGSGFSASSGIRGGRLKERPGFSDVGFSSRVDVRPLDMLGLDCDVDWRAGFSYSFIGTENSDQGSSDDDSPPGHVQILAADTDIKIGDLELRGEFAYIDNEAANEATNAQDAGRFFGLSAGDAAPARAIMGWYVQAAYWIWPDAWKSGMLEESDLGIFVRYDNSDTQYRAVRGFSPDRRRERRELTFGLSFYPVEELVLKADYTIAEAGDETGEVPNRFDLGIGYSF